MPFQPAPNIVSVECRSSLMGQEVENTLYFETPATPTAASVQEICEAVNGWYVTGVLAVLSTSMIYRETYARSLHTAFAPEFTDNTNTGDPGGDGSPPMPGNVTWAIQFRSGLTGRSTRGRNYIIGLTDAATNGNDIAPANAALLLDAYTDLLTVAAGFDWVWVILSRQQDNVILPNAIGYPVLTVGYADLHLDSQRRRLAGRGS